MVDTATISIAQDIYDAIEHGIDTSGNIVGADDTPDKGGVEDGEDFYTVNNQGSGTEMNVWCFQLAKPEKEDEPLLPVALINMQANTPSEQTLDNGIRGVTIEVQFQVNEFEGQVSIGDTTYKMSQALQIFRERLIDLLRNMRFRSVLPTSRPFVEPTEIDNGSSDNGFIVFGGATLSLDYMESITD